MIVGFPRMQRLWPRRPAGTPLWRFLVAEAEAAATAAGASLWYVPPEVHADTITVNSDGTGGRPALGTGPVGRVLSRGTLGNNATQATSANRPIHAPAPGAAAAAAGFGALLYDASDDGFFIPAVAAFGGNFAFSAAVTLPNLTGNRRLIQRSQTGHFTFNTVGAQLFVGKVGVNDFLAHTFPAAGNYVVSVRVIGTTVETRVNGVVVDSRTSGLAPWSAGDGPAALGRIDSGGQPLNGTAGHFAVLPGGDLAALAAIERLGAFIVGAPYPGL